MRPLLRCFPTWLNCSKKCTDIATTITHGQFLNGVLVSSAVSSSTPPPCVLTIAGSDSSSGAGIQADLKTITALGGYGLNAVTSVVSEVPGKVSMFQTLPAELISDQIHVLFDGFPVAAAKTGMLGGIDQVQAVVAAWVTIGKKVPLVIDPVMVATGGGRLLAEDAVDAVKTLLFPLARVITPNMDEAAVLWGRPVTTRAEMEACGHDLSSEHRCAVLVKGGHLEQDAAADVLCHMGKAKWFETERIPGVKTHGTGCTYSAAIATGLAKGLLLEDAVREAKWFVSRAISQHFAWGSVHALNHLQQQ